MLWKNIRMLVLRASLLTIAGCMDIPEPPRGGNCSAECSALENCDPDCTAASCGDGVVAPAAGEQCDPPSQTCSETCLRINCGDGVKDPGEDCDEGGQDTTACDGDCTEPLCGDGWRNPAAGEECDDGNLVNTDECTAVCEAIGCMDGLQNADETDVDCGGHCGAHTCEMLQSCSTSADCMAGVCLAGTCQPDQSRLVTGWTHNCALLDTGAVRCWGYGTHGRLGYGNTISIGDNEVPASAGDVDVGGTVIQLTAGSLHTCALLDTGAVRCWGNGTHGQLGYGNTDTIGDNETPAFAAGDVDIGGTVIQLAAGSQHTCALLDTGAVRCWGDGTHGRLGYGNTDTIGDDETPAYAGDVNVGGTVIQLAAGSEHTCALLDTGAVRCWGYGTYGRLGYGSNTTIGDDEPPASVGNVAVGGTVIQLAAGSEHTCALLDTGAVRCWGYGTYGRLGYGNTESIGDSEPPASAGDVDVGGTVIQVTAGSLHTCALLDTGAVRCWGYGAHGQLGYGKTDHVGDIGPPALAGDIDVGGTVIQVTAGSLHTCALLDTGAVRCWGNGTYGELGYANKDTIGDDETPASAGDVNIGGSISRMMPARSIPETSSTPAMPVLERRSF